MFPCAIHCGGSGSDERMVLHTHGVPMHVSSEQLSFDLDLTLLCIEPRGILLPGPWNTSFRQPSFPEPHRERSRASCLPLRHICANLCWMIERMK